MPAATRTPVRSTSSSLPTYSSPTIDPPSSIDDSLSDVESSTPIHNDSSTTSLEEEPSDLPKSPRLTPKLDNSKSSQKTVAPVLKNSQTRKTTPKRKATPKDKGVVSSIKKEIHSEEKRPLERTRRSERIRALSVGLDSPTFNRSLSVPRGNLSPLLALRQPLGKKEEAGQDIGHLHGLLGQYESQNSTSDTEIGVEAQAAEQDLPAIALEQDGAHLEILSRPGTPSDHQQGEAEHESEAEAEEEEEEEGEQTKAGNISTPSNKSGRPGFRPYSARKDDPSKIELKPKLDINSLIYNFIIKDHPVPEEAGWVYILQGPEYTAGHVKIGMTKTTPNTRAAKWKKDCGEPLLQLVADDYEDAFDYYPLVEKLVGYELSNERRKLYCEPCNKVHQEWFEVDVDIAHQKRRTWRNWILHHKPFEAGKLSPYWHWRAAKLKTSLYVVDWEEWTQPHDSDYWRYWRHELAVAVRYCRHELAVAVQAQFSTKRKDRQFWRNGADVLVILYCNFGEVGVFWGCLMLLIL